MYILFLKTLSLQGFLKRNGLIYFCFWLNQNLIHHEKDFKAYDVIALPNKEVVMVIGADGFYQFGTANLKSLKELSVIPVERD